MIDLTEVQIGEYVDFRAQIKPELASPNRTIKWFDTLKIGGNRYRDQSTGEHYLIEDNGIMFVRLLGMFHHIGEVDQISSYTNTRDELVRSSRVRLALSS